MVDDVIDPRETRIKLIQALEMLHNKRKSVQQRNMVTYHCRLFLEGLHIMINEQRIVDLFIELVQVDSETKHEEKIAVVLKEKFTALGVEVVEDDAKEKQATEPTT